MHLTIQMRRFCLVSIVYSIFETDGCDCRDWYGSCRKIEETWNDEDIWSYKCDPGSNEARFIGCTATNGRIIEPGVNTSMNGFWSACYADNTKLTFDHEPRCNTENIERHVGDIFRIGSFQWLCLETGRWVTGFFYVNVQIVGCFFKNETGNDVLLQIGETGFNGLVKHVCDKFADYPGQVQYYAEVRTDVHVKHPSNKGINKNFPEAKIDSHAEPNRWVHENAEQFIANNDNFRTRIRYLAASRRSWT